METALNGARAVVKEGVAVASGRKLVSSALSLRELLNALSTCHAALALKFALSVIVASAQARIKGHIGICDNCALNIGDTITSKELDEALGSCIHKLGHS